MTRILLTLAAVALTATTADAGPLRNWLAGRRPCQSCTQPQQVQYQPAPQSTQTTYTQPQPVQAVAYYQPAGFAPVMSGGCPGGVCPVK